MLKGSKTAMRLNILLVAVGAISAWAQPNPTERSPLRGILPTASYNLSEIETISNTNGNLTMAVPLAQLPPGRGGLSAGISLVYNSKIWDASSLYRTAGSPDCSSSASITEWSLSRSGFQLRWNRSRFLPGLPNPAVQARTLRDRG